MITLLMLRWWHGLTHMTHRAVTVGQYRGPFPIRYEYLGCDCGRVWFDTLDIERHTYQPYFSLERGEICGWCHGPKWAPIHHVRVQSATIPPPTQRVIE